MSIRTELIDANDTIDRLRALNAELVAMCERLVKYLAPHGYNPIVSDARILITKAKAEGSQT